jgi:hypothetical protein
VSSSSTEIREEWAFASALSPLFCHDFRREMTPEDALKLKQPSNANTAMRASLTEDEKLEKDIGLSSL